MDRWSYATVAILEMCVTGVVAKYKGHIQGVTPVETLCSLFCWCYLIIVGMQWLGIGLEAISGQQRHLSARGSNWPKLENDNDSIGRFLQWSIWRNPIILLGSGTKKKHMI